MIVRDRYGLCREAAATQAGASATFDVTCCLRLGGMRIAEGCRRQAEACGRLGSPMYAHLLHQVAVAVEAGDGHGEILTTVLAGHGDDPGPSAVALRLLGSVHRLGLERRAGALATFYPSVGGTWEPPQTNEVGRSAAFFGGLPHLDRELPLRLLGIAASPLSTWGETPGESRSLS